MLSSPVVRVLASIALFVGVALAVVIFRMFVLEPFRIPAASMEPTLLVGDHVLAQKYRYGLTVGGAQLLAWATPQRGDVIAFRYPPDPGTIYVKRVVAVPGDRVVVRGNRVILDGVEQPMTAAGAYTSDGSECRPHEQDHREEDLGGVRHGVLLNPGFPGGLANHEEIAVPPGALFVMGDNRDHSEDSRQWGLLRADQVVGKLTHVWFSWDRCAERVRSERFATAVHAP